jgi:glycerol-3-phosphate cytidylyltransferase-like family protein
MKIAGMLFGTFDHLHLGHVWLIQDAVARTQKTHGLDAQLCIVVGRDATVTGVKGKMPQQHERERMRGLKALFPACNVVLGHRTDRMYWLRKVRPCVVYLGYDQDRFVDTLTMYKEIAHDHQFKIQRLKPFNTEQYKSSLLTKPQVLISGEVVHGKKLGRTIGYPTANIHLSVVMRRAVASQKLSGVYAVQVLMEGTQYIGAAVVGARRQSSRGSAPLVEVHLFGYHNECYGKVLVMCVEKKIRNLRSYASDERLKKAIAKDVQSIKNYFM